MAYSAIMFQTETLPLMDFDLTSKRCLVLDSGLYVHVAKKLAESFGHVDIYVEWRNNGFPSSKKRQIGTGIPDVERVYDLWDAARAADLIVVTDVYLADEQRAFREMGKPVWGSGNADALEIERVGTKGIMKSLGMPIVPYEVKRGLEALREYLLDKEDVWVKGSIVRGDLETFHWVSQHVSGPRLNLLQKRLGPRARTMEFLVEPSVKGCEYGYDGYCIDGRFGRVALYGPEEKDAGYLGKVVDFADLPEPIRAPTEQFSRALGDLGMRGFFSDEIRIAEDGTPYLIDPACRCGSPPSESYIELFDNWAEVIWAGAHGEVIDLHPVAEYVAQIVLKSDWVTEDEYLPVYYPDEIGAFVKLHNYCILDGEVTVVPQDFPEFGSVIGLGSTRQSAEKSALSHAERIECIDLEYAKDVFQKIDKCLAEGRKVGVDF